MPERPVSTAKPLAGRRILLAEDGPDNQHLISLRLRQQGATVEVAENGRIALDLALAAELRGQPYDLIFMDMQMPEMDGYTATSRLREAGYRRPVVALTAHAMSGDREKCLQAGCDEYTTKPIDIQRMITIALAQMARAAGQASSTTGNQRETTAALAIADSAQGTKQPLVSELATDPDMQEAIDRYVARLQMTAADLACVLAGEEIADLSRKVHQIKGAAGGYGFPQISAAAAELEAQLKAGGPTDQRDRQLARLIGLCHLAQPATQTARQPRPEEHAR